MQYISPIKILKHFLPDESDLNKKSIRKLKKVMRLEMDLQEDGPMLKEPYEISNNDVERLLDYEQLQHDLPVHYHIYNSKVLLEVLETPKPDRIHVVVKAYSENGLIIPDFSNEMLRVKTVEYIDKNQLLDFNFSLRELYRDKRYQNVPLYLFYNSIGSAKNWGKTYIELSAHLDDMFKMISWLKPELFPTTYQFLLSEPFIRMLNFLPQPLHVRRNKIISLIQKRLREVPMRLREFQLESLRLLRTAQADQETMRIINSDIDKLVAWKIQRDQKRTEQEQKQQSHEHSKSYAHSKQQNSGNRDTYNHYQSKSSYDSSSGYTHKKTESK